MSMKLLIAYDGSEFSDRALDDLTHAGLPAQAEVTVLTVADVLMPPGTDWRMLVAQTDLPAAVLVARQRAVQAIEGAQAMAERGAARVRGLFPGWKVTAHSVADSPAWGVLKLADEMKPDLLVIGSHGRGPVQRLVLGSVSQKVVTEARCSVRVVRPASPKNGPLRLLVAVDGSRESLAAVETVRHRHWPEGTRATVMMVVDPRLETVVAWPGVYANSWVEQRDADAREWASRVAEKLATDLDAAGLRTEMHIFAGDPRHVLLQQSEEFGVSCIFLGAHGLQHADRRALGSVAAAVVSRAHCTVEVIRPA